MKLIGQITEGARCEGAIVYRHARGWRTFLPTPWHTILLDLRRRSYGTGGGWQLTVDWYGRRVRCPNGSGIYVDPSRLAMEYGCPCAICSLGSTWRMPWA